METHLQKDHTRKNVDKLIYAELYKAALQHVERLVKELKKDPPCTFYMHVYFVYLDYLLYSIIST